MIQFKETSYHGTDIADTILKKGIYKYENNEFVFYEGEYHQDASNRLRVEHFMKIIENKKVF